MDNRANENVAEAYVVPDKGSQARLAGSGNRPVPPFVSRRRVTRVLQRE